MPALTDILLQADRLVLPSTDGGVVRDISPHPGETSDAYAQRTGLDLRQAPAMVTRYDRRTRTADVSIGPVTIRGVAVRSIKADGEEVPMLVKAGDVLTLISLAQLPSGRTPGREHMWLCPVAFVAGRSSKDLQIALRTACRARREQERTMH